MCLYVYPDSKLQNYPDDTVCYKFGVIKDNKFISPFRGYKYSFNEQYYTQIQKEPESVILDYGKHISYICHGFHSFSKYLYCYKWIKINYDTLEFILDPDITISDICICKCVIPANSLVWFGNFETPDEDNNAYVSDNIIITDRYEIFK